MSAPGRVMGAALALGDGSVVLRVSAPLDPRSVRPDTVRVVDDEGNVKILDLGLARVQNQLAVDEEGETAARADLTASGGRQTRHENHRPNGPL